MQNRETMVFDIPTRLENDPRGEERKIFEKVPYVQPGT
jgi:para-nitrobenzyl esterase